MNLSSFIDRSALIGSSDMLWNIKSHLEDFVLHSVFRMIYSPLSSIVGSELYLSAPSVLVHLRDALLGVFGILELYSRDFSEGHEVSDNILLS